MPKVTKAKHVHAKSVKDAKHADVKHNGNAVFNHKVEQVLRAILMPMDDAVQNSVSVSANATLHVNAMNDSILNNIAPVWYKVGLSSIKGWTFTPLQNSLLSLLGIKPSVAMYIMSKHCLRGTDDAAVDQAAPALVEKEDALLMFAPALVAAAYSLVMHYPKCVVEVQEHLKTYGNYPIHFAYSV